MQPVRQLLERIVVGELDFDAPDGEGVRLIFLLLTPPRAFGEELQVLAAIAKLMIQDEVRAALTAAPDTRAVISALEQADRASATLTPLPSPSMTDSTTSTV